MNPISLLDFLKSELTDMYEIVCFLSQQYSKNINIEVLCLKKCPCCGYKTLNLESNHLYEICPVCYWEYDPIQNDNPHYSGGANSVSLFDATHNYKKFGAISKEYIRFVRKPYNFEK